MKKFVWLFLLYRHMAGIRHPQPECLPKIFSLRDFWKKRNEIVIVRKVVALGDIFIHRMLFEDMKKINPEIIICFATNSQFFDALRDHPFIDKLIDCSTNINDYLTVYDTSSVCIRHESAMGISNTSHRSDIWASHIGLELKSHNMHFHIDLEAQKWAEETIKQFQKKGKPVVLLCPTTSNLHKNITEGQIEIIVNYLREKNCVVFSMTIPLPVIAKLNIPNFPRPPLPKLIALVNAADYVISTDTSYFHCAGGLKRPLLGIFAYTNGKIYGKYYDFELIQKHRDNGDWDCGPCYNHLRCIRDSNISHPCITEINKTMLIDGIDRMFQRWPWKT